MTPAKVARKAKPRSRASGRVAAVGMRGQYEGARSDVRELQGWTPGLGSADSDTLGDLPALRARSRDAERNQPIAAGALLTKLDNIVGAGLWPSSQLDWAYLGMTEDEGNAWKQDAQRVFEAVAMSKNLDVTRKNNFPQLTRLAMRAKMSGGDCFALRRYVPRPGDLLALKVQLFEADRCANPPGRYNDATLREGVQLDQFGAAVGYWFASHQPNAFEYGQGQPKYEFVPAISSRTGAPMVLHIIDQVRPGQTRGIPELAPILRQLKQLDRYTDSELAAAVIASFFTVFIKKTSGGENEPVIDGLDDAVTRDLFAAANEVKLGQGAIVGLEDGEAIETANPSRPNAQMEPFITAITKFMGVALGLPSELLLKAFNSSYSASRAALLEAWRTFETAQDWLVSTFCQPVWEWILTEAIGRGLLVAPGFDADPLARRAYLAAAWTGPTVSALDPLNEVQAAALRVEKGFSTLQLEAPALVGQPWDRIHAQRKTERAARIADGLESDAFPLASGGAMKANTAANPAPAAPTPAPTAPDNAGAISAAA